MLNMNENKNKENEQNKNKKYLLLLLLALLIVVICAIIIPFSLAKRPTDAGNQEISITDGSIPLASGTDEAITDATDKEEKEEETPVVDTTPVTIPEEEVPLAPVAPTVNPAPVVTNVAAVAQDVAAITDLLEEVVTVTDDTPVTPAEVEDEVNEIERELEEAARKEAEINALKAKLMAIKKDMAGIASDNVAKATEYTKVLTELGEATDEYVETMNNLNDKLTQAKEDAIIVAQASVEGIKALEETLSDKDSTLYKYYHESARNNKDDVAIDSTGINWALGGTKKAGEGVNTELVNDISANDQISDEVKEVIVGEDVVSADISENNTTGLPVKASSDEKIENPDVAYKVIQEVSKQQGTQYEIWWTTDFDVEEGETIDVYCLSADDQLYVGTTVKGKENADKSGVLTIGGTIITTDTSELQQIATDVDDASELLNQMTEETYSSEVVADEKEVEQVADQIMSDLEEERNEVLVEYATATGKTIEEAKEDYDNDFGTSLVVEK